MDKKFGEVIRLIEKDYFNLLTHGIDISDTNKRFKLLDSNLEDTYARIKCKNKRFSLSFELWIWVTTHERGDYLDVDYICWEILYRCSENNIESFVNKGKENLGEFSASEHLECFVVEEDNDDDYESAITFSKEYKANSFIYEASDITDSMIKEIARILTDYKEAIIETLNQNLENKFVYKVE